MSFATRLNYEDKRTLSLSSLGGALEFYDFVIYIFYAKIISDLFFPNTLSPFWAMLNTYGIFAAGYFFRPLGGIVMAHFGDLLGRKRLFSLSILLMALPTLIIGFLPTFSTLGYFAPVLLLFMRVIQGIAIGGEVPAAWTFVSEHVPTSKVGFANGLLTAGLSLGILLGSLMSLWISLQFSESQIYQWAWRIPFICGGILGLITLYLRQFLKETPVFQAIEAQQKQSRQIPIQQVLHHHKGAVIVGMLFTWFLTGCVIVLILAMPNLLMTTFGFDRTLTFEMQSAAIVMQMIGCVVVGYATDRLGCSTVMMVGAVAVMIFAALFYTHLEHGDLYHIILLYLCLGFCSGTVGMVASGMVKMFPAPIRFSGISFSYNVSYAIIGGVTLPLVHWLSRFNPIGAMYYILVTAAVAFFTAWIFKAKYEYE
ncbi:MFS transporter [Acinetobacter sp.]|uniref:MFS transporter n=1 Tax=Acinetobacter sp. TaxID=472 RepID=UPI0031E3A7CC